MLVQYQERQSPQRVGVTRHLVDVNQEDKSRIRFSRVGINSAGLGNITKNQKLFRKYFESLSEVDLLSGFSSSHFRNFHRLELICDALIDIFRHDRVKVSIWDVRLLGIRFLVQIGYSCLGVVRLGSGETGRLIVSEVFEIVSLTRSCRDSSSLSRTRTNRTMSTCSCSTRLFCS